MLGKISHRWKDPWEEPVAERTSERERMRAAWMSVQAENAEKGNPAERVYRQGASKISLCGSIIPSVILGNVWESHFSFMLWLWYGFSGPIPRQMMFKNVCENLRSISLEFLGYTPSMGVYFAPSFCPLPFYIIFIANRLLFLLYFGN